MLRLNQYQELHEDRVESLFYEMIHFVSVVNDLDPLEVEEWDSFKLIDEYDNVKNATKFSTKPVDHIEIEGVQLELIPFHLLTLGQFIDLETMVNDSFFNNLHKIAATIYLQMEGGGMVELKPERYAEINIDYRSSLIEQLPACSVVGACNKYLDFRQNFFNSYDIFQDPFEGIDINTMDDEERAIYEEEKRAHEKRGGNQWSDILNVLAQNDITKFPQVLETNLFMAFNQVTWLKSNEK
jgi:hypothetical protein